LVHFWTEISAETGTFNPAGTGTVISVQVLISAGTGTEPNFGRSLLLKPNFALKHDVLLYQKHSNQR